MIELRSPQASDAEALFPLIYQTPVTDTIRWDGPESLEIFREELAKRGEATRAGEIYNYTILENSSGRPIGSASINVGESTRHATIGFWVGEPYQSHGYGTQVVGKLLGHGFERLKLDSIDAEVFTGNEASRRALEKNGFTLERTVQAAVEKRGVFLDVWIFRITREFFYAQGNG
jgi:ribosomal-protein-alanine N-acetyltransferase